VVLRRPGDRSEEKKYETFVEDREVSEFGRSNYFSSVKKNTDIIDMYGRYYEWRPVEVEPGTIKIHDFQKKVKD
jgi:hypothetical protein